MNFVPCSAVLPLECFFPCRGGAHDIPCRFADNRVSKTSLCITCIICISKIRHNSSDGKHLTLEIASQKRAPHMHKCPPQACTILFASFNQDLLSPLAAKWMPPFARDCSAHRRAC